MLNTGSEHSITDQNDFWNSLHLDILTSNQKFSQEDYLSFIERGFLFSAFFRGCSPLELVAYQHILSFHDYGFVLILDMSSLPSIDELEFHHFIKKSHPGRSILVGPLIINRICLLITGDTFYPENPYKEQSAAFAKELIQEIDGKYHAAISVGVGSQQNIKTIYTSFIDALSSMYFSASGQISYYHEVRLGSTSIHFDYTLTEQHLIDALRLRKADAYDYFGMIMNWIRPLNDDTKRTKILELLVLANRAMDIDGQSEAKHINYMTYANEFMSLQGEQLVEFAYRIFMYIASYVKPQNTIDYSNNIVTATWNYLEYHYAEDISLEDVAEQVNISPQYFSKLIKKNTGFNFTDWLAMLRVKKAKELLTNTNLTVKEVCFMVGYKDPNYFSRIFKKRIGITPSEYVKTSSYFNN